MFKPYKYIVKMVAHLNGKTATFMPKPIHGDNGSGMHVHQSIWKDGKNLFYKEGNYAKFKRYCKMVYRWSLGHARSVAAFTTQAQNSYKRLIPGFEAPSILTYSSQNHQHQLEFYGKVKTCKSRDVSQIALLVRI